MKKSFLVIILTLFVLLMSSCQSSHSVVYPCEYVDNFVSKDGKVDITFDAKVIVPDVDKFPVIQIDPQPISKELMQMMVDEFMGGETGYYPESYLTKSDIEEKLVDYKTTLNNDALIKEEYEEYYQGKEIDYKTIKEAIKRRIVEYTNMLKHAPEKRERVASGLNLRPSYFYQAQDCNYRKKELKLTQEQLDERAKNPQEHLYLVSDKEMPSGDYIRFIVYNEIVYDRPYCSIHGVEHSEVQVYRARNDFFRLHGRPLCCANPINTVLQENFDDPYPVLTISEEEAVQMAQKVLDDLGIDNFYHAMTDIRNEYPTIEESESGVDYYDMEGKFYKLTFLPKYRDVPFVFANNQYATPDGQASAPFFFESIHMKVSNDAIVEFRWSNPTDISNVINESAKLLDFKKVMKIAKNYMKLKYNMPTIAPVREGSETYQQDLAKFIGANIDITQIRLGLGGVAAYNKPGEYMLIPMWNFYGSYTIDSTNDKEDREYPQTFLPYVTVNAVDGSIVEQWARVDWD